MAIQRISSDQLSANSVNVLTHLQTTGTPSTSNYLRGDGTWSIATDPAQTDTITASFIAANSAGAYANGAFATANSSFTSANGIIAWNTANASFISANNLVGIDLTQNNSIEASFTAANSSGVYANGAFAKANNAASTGKAIAMSIVFGG